MTNIKIDMSKQNGIIKPMNAVNNGPVPIGVRESYTNFYDYKAARIPYARNHDASFCSDYNGEHIVDVHRIFKNFDADENDPKSYVFGPTDNYLKNTIDAGTKIYYRLGASIEHGYKYGAYPPKNYLKWAKICEHIIRHYTEGWADGFNYDIEYWEIWNEPDLFTGEKSPCWQGTGEEFVDFYCIAAKHLKQCFPDKKIGGPAFATIWQLEGEEYKKLFFEKIAKENIPLDFLSYHWYGKELNKLVETIEYARNQLDSFGLYDTETILNEWNYIKGWHAEDWKYSIKAEKGLKGSSFITSAMCVGQAKPLDMLMYYDARPCTMNGMFAHETFECLKGYYSIFAWSDLSKLSNYVDCGYRENNIYYTAAANNIESAIFLTYFDDEKEDISEFVSIKVNSLFDKTKAEFYILDEDNNLKCMNSQYFTSKEFEINMDVKIFSSILIKFKQY